MTEMEIMSQFNTFLISNAIYLAAGFLFCGLLSEW